jgi:hypothetical protein
MPTGRCDFPQHHNSPSAGPPIGLLAAIAIGAAVIAAWHAVVVALVVCCFLAGIAGAVFLLWHAGHAEPYDAALRGQKLRSASWRPTASPAASESRTALLEAENRELRRRLEAGPGHQHNHLHLHGVSAAEAAELVASRRDRAAIEKRQQW